MNEPCPKCTATETIALIVPGGGIQTRCAECDRFLSWQELPKSIKKKGEK
ncbi:MAG: hypothetical protein KME15_20245 [Drouetiella hepatica Uher 2000/2452]|uniref:Uncharacterized protein n=1 Tax=Drouetiella hepatica Uher 2000/2452 TaxID=904376 RepID=A0A951QFI9_9CYAN|nr:hypothetical protein [Drouetiella hepatica Uher 2000/2452]